MWQYTLAELANCKFPYNPVSAVGRGYYGRTDGRTDVAHFVFPCELITDGRLVNRLDIPE